MSLDVWNHSLVDTLMSPREDWNEKGPFGEWHSLTQVSPVTREIKQCG